MRCHRLNKKTSQISASQSITNPSSIWFHFNDVQVQVAISIYWINFCPINEQTIDEQCATEEQQQDWENGEDIDPLFYPHRWCATISF